MDRGVNNHWISAQNQTGVPEKVQVEINVGDTAYYQTCICGLCHSFVERPRPWPEDTDRGIVTEGEGLWQEVTLVVAIKTM